MPFFRRRISNARVTLSSASAAAEALAGPTWPVAEFAPSGGSLKYANTAEEPSGSGRFQALRLRRAPPRRNVYDHGEIKSTAKILPVIRMRGGWRASGAAVHRRAAVKPRSPRAKYKERPRASASSSRPDDFSSDVPGAASAGRCAAETLRERRGGSAVFTCDCPSPRRSPRG